MKLIIEDDEGRTTVVPFVRDEITIGRQEGNTIRLTERNVSRRHARLSKLGGNIMVEDLGSFTGVRVNGQRITARTTIHEGDLVEIGDYDLNFQETSEVTATPVAHAPAAYADEESTAPMERTPPATRPPNGASPFAQLDDEEGSTTSPGMRAPPEPHASHGVTAVVRLSDVHPGLPEREIYDLPKNQVPRLVGFAGALRGREFFLLRSEVRIGRTEENDIQIDHPSMSRQHARLQRQDDGSWKVSDNRSANGVRLNGEDYQIATVRHDDTLELGYVKFRFVMPGLPFEMPEETTGSSEVSEPTRTTVVERRYRPWLIGVTLVGGLVLAGSGALLLLRTSPVKSERTETDTAAAQLVHAGQRAFLQDDFVTASENFRRAQNLDPTLAVPQRAKASAELSNQLAFRAMNAAIARGDWDVAWDALPKIPADSAFFVRGKERESEIKRGYLGLHVERMSGAMQAGRWADCLQEGNLVQLADPENATARLAIAQCTRETEKASAPKTVVRAPAKALPPKVVASADEEKPEAPVETPPAPPPPAVAPALNALEARADDLIKNAGAKTLSNADLDGAVHDYLEAVALKPPDALLAKAYRGLGITYARQGAMPQAAHYYELYLPLCTNAKEKASLEKMLADFKRQGP